MKLVVIMPALNEEATIADVIAGRDTVLERAVEALREIKAKGQPFFLAVGFWKPHGPFNAPKRYWDLYQCDAIPLPNHPEWPAGSPRRTAPTWKRSPSAGLGCARPAKAPSPTPGSPFRPMSGALTWRSRPASPAF